jgi:Protein of unknown function (DUF3300)/Protein of unknown function (DUF2950)
MKPITLLAVTLSALISVAIQTPAQIAVPPPAPVVQLRSAAELDQLLGTIALYPDPLIAQILPAATLPTLDLFRPIRNQKNLGPKTSSIASSTTTYDPDDTWTLAKEE